MRFPFSNSITSYPASLAVDRAGQTLCCVSLLLIASTTLFVTSASAEATLTQLRNQTSTLLRNEALASDFADECQHLTALCDLYVVLRCDSRYDQSEMLQQDGNKIRRRLLTAARQIQARLRRENIVRPSGLSQEVDRALRDAIEGQKSDESTLGSATTASTAGRAAAGIADNGWQLVELIQRIVAPDFWETNGGPGSIHYFAMRRVLVVRASTDVHEQIRDLLFALQR